MQTELESMFERTNELVNELEKEYNSCLKLEKVSDKAKNLTHEIIEKLRNILDHTMYICWSRYFASKLTDNDKKRATVYFPITKNIDAFRSTLGRGIMLDLDKFNKPLYDLLLDKQPFSSQDNQWLKILAKITTEGKHINLIPQKRTESRRIKVTNTRGVSTSWDPTMVKFGNGVVVAGAPINPQTQRIIPTPDVTETIEIWVSFILEGCDVNALGFCKEASQKIRVLVEKILSLLS